MNRIDLVLLKPPYTKMLVITAFNAVMKSRSVPKFRIDQLYKSHENYAVSDRLRNQSIQFFARVMLVTTIAGIKRNCKIGGDVV